jgi:hypothetical protein
MNDQPTYADLAAMRDRALAAEKGAAELREQLTNLKEWSATLADVADDLRAELADERALADRLASSMERMQVNWNSKAWHEWEEARKP